MLQEDTNPSAVFDKELSFGDLIHRFGCHSESPNQKIKEQKINPLGNIWREAVEYSCCCRNVHLSLFNNFPCNNVSICDAGDVEGMSACSSGSSSLCDKHVPSNNFQLSYPKIQVSHVCVDDDSNGKLDEELSENSFPSSDILFGEKRRRNNQACKKFRKAKKSRQQQLCLAAEQLQRENSVMASKINKLEKEIKTWKEFFLNHPMHLQCSE